MFAGFRESSAVCEFLGVISCLQGSGSHQLFVGPGSQTETHMPADDELTRMIDDTEQSLTTGAVEADVLVVGGGVAGLTAGLFTARAGLDTLVVNHGESILRRNAHLENFPGFPAGVNPRLFVDLLEAQVDRNGCERLSGRVTELGRDNGQFVATVADTSTTRAVKKSETDGQRVTGETELHRADVDHVTAGAVVAASWSDTTYLDGLDVELRTAGSKQYLQPDAAGRTTVDGLYAAGRLAEQYHQAIVSAGHGAQVGITVVHDADVPFYHDWVTTEGYFTDRGREVPPGCEEIDEAERQLRERESLQTMQEYFAEPHEDDQRTHPTLSDDS